jgi:hypothetical protein
MPPRQVGTGSRTIVLSTGVSAASSGSWFALGGAYRSFGMRCVRGTSIGTSNFTVSLRGGLSTRSTTGAAVGAIGAYTPSTLIAYTQALVGKIKLSTGLVPASYIKAVVSVLTTAANRKLRIEVVAIP